jgi:hypothetical protein
MYETEREPYGDTQHELREALYALNRVIARVEDESPESSLGREWSALVAARNDVWNVGVRQWGWRD